MCSVKVLIFIENLAQDADAASTKLVPSAVAMDSAATCK